MQSLFLLVFIIIVNWMFQLGIGPSLLKFSETVV